MDAYTTITKAAARMHREQLERKLAGNTGKEILVVKQDRWCVGRYQPLLWWNDNSLWSPPETAAWTFSQSIEYGVLSGDALLPAMPPYTARIPTASTLYYSNSDPFWRTIPQGILVEERHLLALGTHVPMHADRNAHGLIVYVGEELEKEPRAYGWRQALDEARQKASDRKP